MSFQKQCPKLAVQGVTCEPEARSWASATKSFDTRCGWYRRPEPCDFVWVRHYGRALSAMCAQTIWAPGCARNPYFVILKCLTAGFDASLTLGIWHFHPVAPISASFHTFFAHIHHIHSFLG